MGRVFSSSVVLTRFSPLNLPALVAWYSADFGVYNDAGVTLATNGQTVQQWNDRGGRYNLSQTPSGSLSFSTVGLQSVSATGDFQDIETVADVITFGVATQLSVFVVAQVSSTPAAFNNDRLISFTGTGAPDDFSNTSSFLILRNGVGNAPAYGCTPLVDGSNVSMDTSLRMGFTINGTAIATFVNNVVGPTGTATGTLTLSTGTLKVSNPGNDWHGPISEIVIANSALDSVQRGQLDSYFRDHWGI